MLRDCHLKILKNRHDPRVRELIHQLGEDRVIHEVLDAECCWDNTGRPYYKIWPQMCDCMQHCSIDIPASCLRFPYSVVEIRLPSCRLIRPLAGSMLVVGATREQLIRARDERLALGDIDQAMAEMFGAAALREAKTRCRASFANSLQEAESLHGKLTFTLGIYYQTSHDLQTHNYTVSAVRAYENETIEAALERWKAEPDNGVADRLNDVSFESVLRICVATMFFAVDNHELVMPDIPREILTVNARTKSQHVSEQKRIQRELKRCRGWKVGSEIDLPRPLVNRLERRDPTGRELEYGHVRSGHMRMQPCGEGSRDRKLIFVAPTVVRPDLPIRTAHGYRIRGKDK